jgi:hypothetical protein
LRNLFLVSAFMPSTICPTGDRPLSGFCVFLPEPGGAVSHFGCTAVAHTLAAVQEMPFLLPEQLISCCSCEAGITCRCDDAKQFAMEYAAADALMTLFLGITTRILCDP